MGGAVAVVRSAAEKNTGDDHRCDSNRDPCFDRPTCPPWCGLGWFRRVEVVAAFFTEPLVIAKNRGAALGTGALSHQLILTHGGICPHERLFRCRGLRPAVPGKLWRVGQCSTLVVPTCRWLFRIGRPRGHIYAGSCRPCRGCIGTCRGIGATCSLWCCTCGSSQGR